MSETSRRKKELGREAGELGRVIGTVSIRYPEVVDEFKHLAKTRGVKPSEAMKEAIELWIAFQEMRDLDPRALLVAMKLYERLMITTTRLLVEISTIFTGGLVQSQLQTTQSIVANYLAQQEEESKETTKTVEEPPEIRRVRAKLIELTTDILTKMVTTMVTTMARTYMPTKTTTQPPAEATPVEKIEKETIVEE